MLATSHDADEDRKRHECGTTIIQMVQLTKADARATSVFAMLARDDRLCRRRRRFSVTSDSILIMY